MEHLLVIIKSTNVYGPLQKQNDTSASLFHLTSPHHPKVLPSPIPQGSTGRSKLSFQK